MCAPETWPLRADRSAAAPSIGVAAWVATSLALATAALLAFLAEPSGGVSAAPRWADAIDWQPALASSEPWRAWSAAFVHYSPRHLLANLAGAVGVAALGWAARVPIRSAIAWLIAWPLVHVGLWVQPDLSHYGGLSGVLHAGVAVVAVHLGFSGLRAQRRIGVALVVALIFKLLTETPWAGAISHPPGWDIAVAPGAHVSGVAVGAAMSLLAELLHRVVRAAREAIGAADSHA